MVCLLLDVIFHDLQADKMLKSLGHFDYMQIRSAHTTKMSHSFDVCNFIAMAAVEVVEEATLHRKHKSDSENKIESLRFHMLSSYDVITFCYYWSEFEIEMATHR